MFWFGFPAAAVLHQLKCSLLCVLIAVGEHNILRKENFASFWLETKGNKCGQ